MAYIAPSSTVKLLADVPIDMNLDHTLWFANRQNQTDYFSSKTVRLFAPTTYTRKGRGVIKLEVKADDVYHCNYMMFQNIAFGNKWFYAFITSVEYVSNTVTQVTFAIDQLQTWFFEMQLAQCYVEREHADHDEVGDNLIPEGLELGDYVYEDNDYDWCHMFTTYDVVVYTSFGTSFINNQWQFTNTQGRYLWGIYTGLNIRVFRSIENQATINSLNGFFSAIVDAGKSDGVVAIIMIPHETLDENLDPVQISHTIPKITTIDTYYTPRNKKLLTSPYCFIEAQNCEGSTAIFPQEYFGGANPSVCQFMITYGISAAPVALCVPVNYKGSEFNYPEGLFINNFTQCSYNIDMFKAYMAQSLTARIGQNIIDDIQEGKASYSRFEKTGADWGGVRREIEAGRASSSASNSVASFDSGSLADMTRAGLQSERGQAIAGSIGATVAGIAIATGSGANILGSIYDSLSQLYAKAIQPPHNSGSNTPDYFTANRLKGFWFFHRTIRREFAEIIDAYFDRFGYATHRIKVPNIHARQRWTYTKTVGCQVSGNLPSDAVATIQNIFDKGITFWSDPANFGNYSLANPII